MAAGDLTDLATVKAWLGLPVDAGPNDGVLATLITAASGFVGDYLDRALLSADYTEVYDGCGAEWMLLPPGADHGGSVGGVFRPDPDSGGRSRRGDPGLSVRRTAAVADRPIAFPTDVRWW